MIGALHMRRCSTSSERTTILQEQLICRSIHCGCYVPSHQHADRYTPGQHTREPPVLDCLQARTSGEQNQVFFWGLKLLCLVFFRCLNSPGSRKSVWLTASPTIKAYSPTLSSILFFTSSNLLPSISYTYKYNLS